MVIRHAWLLSGVAIVALAGALTATGFAGPRAPTFDRGRLEMNAPESTVAADNVRGPAQVGTHTASAMSSAVSAMALYKEFTARGYTLDAVRSAREAVPRVFLARLPGDLPAINSLDLRKAVFIKMMLPLILVENERIRADRIRALDIRRRLEEGHTVPSDELAWLAALADRYGVDDGNLDELFRRVDVIPPALALGQAAVETGWGTSRVAQAGHAMFGEMVFRIDGDTVVESNVRVFENLSSAVTAYTRNLNTHRAYAEFRAARADMRRSGADLDGYELARHLLRYSELKDDYVRLVRLVIRSNDLRSFDHARLGN
jgi:Bax protein